MDAKRQRHGRLTALGIVLLAALMTGLTACAHSTAGASGAGAPPTAAQRAIAGTGTPGATPQSASEGTGASTSGSLGTIAGDVVAGPTCPVETVEDPCPPKPVTDRQVLVMTPGGAVAATTTTDANGRFAVRVLPGSYTVRAQTSPGMLGLSQMTPDDVTVRAGEVTIVRIELDTGIR